MNRNSKKKVKISSPASRMNRFPSWLRHIILFAYELSLFRVGAIGVSIIILATIGQLYTLAGLILVLWILIFSVVLYLKLQIDKDDESRS